ncbi:iron-containing alcohol dehydrogenase family protein [Halobacteria archaeon AArc-dxtr1]|nr:iron-containing alcohol dehydrogenase family protein [Halobacteria archaeon AArc-dxtr1]
MLPVPDAFEYEHRGCELVYGRGCIDGLGAVLAEHNRERALIVCGANVGANDALMNPIRDGLGERHVGTYDGTTPAKTAESAFEAIETAEHADADVLVGVGGGSSLDIARQAAAFAADDRSLADLRREAREEGTVRPPESDGSAASDDDRPDVVVIPTTFAGADVSSGGSLEVLSANESSTGQPVTISGSAMPIADFADPALFETTPTRVLAGSAMNGLDKGIETPYARNATPVSDATAIHGLRLLSEALPRVVGSDSGAEATDPGTDPAPMDRAVAGSLLVQLDRKLSVIHAFGHGFARRYDVQQGAVHAVLAPHVLRYLFSRVDASRELLAAGLGVDPGGLSEAELGEAVVDAVAELRDALGQPTRLRDLPETEREELPAVAEFIVEDYFMDNAPAGLEPTPAGIEAVLNDAW